MESRGAERGSDLKGRGGGSRLNPSPVSISTRGSPHLKSSSMDAAWKKANGGPVAAAGAEEAGGRVNVTDMNG